MTLGRPQLVLDIGGVLLADLTPPFWRWVAAQTAAPYDDVLTRFRREVRDALWTGAITEGQFWGWLCAKFPPIDDCVARAQLATMLKPLPASAQLATWAQSVDIHLLSNHRAEWVMPALKDTLSHVKSITISSAVGYCKPHPAIYEVAASKLAPDAVTVYVDDQETNFPPASALGWRTACADARGDWLSTLLPSLDDDYRAAM